MTEPFEYNGRTYTFTKSGNEYTIFRDDGMQAWDTYRQAHWVGEEETAPFAAYKPAFSNLTECKQAIRGERPSTYYHCLVFAATAYAAAKIAELEDADAANRHPEPVTPNP